MTGATASSGTSREAAGRLLILILASVALSLILYRSTLQYGFDYDDYHLLRPLAWAEVLRAFRGTWDATGIEPPFYRPLTVAFYALRFWLLGFSAFSYRLLGLVLFGVAAGLFGFGVGALARSFRAAAIAAAIYVVHPAMPRAQALWPTNQMHLLASITIGGAFAWWAYRGRFQPSRWWGLLPVAAVAFLIKEDGVVLLPALVLLQGVHWWLGDKAAPRLLPRPSWTIAAAVLLTGLLLLRRAALGGLGGYGADPRWSNFAPGMWTGFLAWRTDAWLPWRYVEGFAVLALVGGLAALVTRRSGFDRSLRVGLVGGILVAALFNLPFVFVTKQEQYHNIGSFSSVALASGVLLVIGARSSRWWRVATGSFVAAGLVAFASGSQHRVPLFEPYSNVVLGHDRIVLGWPGLPAEIQAFVEAKLAVSGRSPAISDLNPDVALYDAYAVERDGDGRAFRWMPSHAVLLVGPAVRAVMIPIDSISGPDWTYQVTAHPAGGPDVVATLREPGWRELVVPAPRGWRRWIAGTRRIDLNVSPTWRPTDVWPLAEDRRELGVRLGAISVRTDR